MINSQSISTLLVGLWGHIAPRRRKQFYFLLVLMVAASFAEVFSIGAVLPFLMALSAPDTIFEHPFAQVFVHALGLSSANQILLPLAMLFALAVIFTGFLRLLLLWTSTKLSFATGADISLCIYEKTLYQPYSVHISRNSSELINAVTGKSNGVVYTTVLPLLNLISAMLILIAILAILVAINPVVALAAFSGFGSIYIVLVLLTKGRLSRNSARVAHQSTQVIRILQEGLGGIRDILIDGSQAIYCAIYRQADHDLRRAQGDSLFISQSPRYGMEALGMLVIIALAYFLTFGDGGGAIPVLGTLALGAQRLLPVLQQAYVAWSSIKSGQSSLQDTLSLLNQPLPEYVTQDLAGPMSFAHSIYLDNVGFSYSPQAKWTFQRVNLEVPKGSRVGIIGKTGGGKSTLVDIITGLLQPTEGGLRIDGVRVLESNKRAWQAHIAYVPQAIFLSDASIEENIAFGVPRNAIDPKRLRWAAEKAQLSDLIDSWPHQYQTKVGERGVRLSGGQRQRIGIARALYKQADVIIFDEATSALDVNTEEAIMRAIDGLDERLTIFIIAHRTATLKNCKIIVEVSGGEIRRVGDYQDIAV